MNHWPYQQLGNLRSDEKYSMTGGPFGSNLVSLDYVNDGVPVIRGCNLPDDGPFSFDDFVFVTEKKADALRPNNAHPGDLIFTQRGTLGQVGIIPENSAYKRYVISQSQMKLKVDPIKADPKYVYYFFRMRSTIESIHNLAISCGIPHINLDILRKFHIVTPPLPTQCKIAAILSAYDDLIENNRRRIVLLEKLAEELYREWFVRLRFPGHEKVKVVKGVPEGWRNLKFRDIIDYYIGGGWGEDSQSTSFPEGAYVIRGTDIPDFDSGHFVDCPFRYHKTSNIKSRVMQSGDFVFEVSGGSKDQLLGRNIMVTKGILDFLAAPVIPASFCKLIRFNKEVASPLFMKYFMKLFYDSDLFGIYQVQSTGISNFQFENLLKFQTVMLPSPDLQEKFEEHIRPVIEMKDDICLSNIKLQRLRNMLLPRLISGKLSVENLDIQFPPSMVEVGHA